jgi:hypothetical protein
MEDHFWTIIGALTIIAALMANHPLRPQQTAALEMRIADTFNNLVQVVSCDRNCAADATTP